jgi:hypothetical protein
MDDKLSVSTVPESINMSPFKFVVATYNKRKSVALIIRLICVIVPYIIELR